MMHGRRWLLVLFLLAVAYSPGSSQETWPPRNATAPGGSPAFNDWRPPPFLPATFQDDPLKSSEKANGQSRPNGNANGNGNGKSNGDKAPKHIRDNGFLVEEAFNQEKGEVQHIFNAINLWDRNSLVRSRNYTMSYTMELPLGGQDHQFSFTTQFITLYQRFHGGPAGQLGDIGDTFLNYRYQLLADDDFLWVAPRATLIVPTGDERIGFGTGKVGYQFNLPVSKYTEWFDYHFNGGFTYTPNVSSFLDEGRRSPRHDLRGYNLGGTVLWKPRVDLHFFTEVLALWFDQIDDTGARDMGRQVFVNPGFRYAIIQDPVEWVLGVAVPVGLTRNTPDIGVFAYMSIEFGFRKDENEKKNGENGKD